MARPIPAGLACLCIAFPPPGLLPSPVLVISSARSCDTSRWATWRRSEAPSLEPSPGTHLGRWAVGAGPRASTSAGAAGGYCRRAAWLCRRAAARGGGPSPLSPLCAGCFSHLQSKGTSQGSSAGPGAGFLLFGRTHNCGKAPGQASGAQPHAPQAGARAPPDFLFKAPSFHEAFSAQGTSAPDLPGFRNHL